MFDSIDKAVPLMTPTFFDDNDPNNPKRKTYIEREAVLREMTSKPLPKDAQHLYFAMRNMVRKAPTADVAEVRHGEWIAVPSSDMSTGKAYKCSECKKMRYGVRLPPYCQECGAKMDGKANKEKCMNLN